MEALRRARQQLEAHEANERRRREPIAIVGMACRFPGGANDLASYWRLLDDGVDAVRELPAGRVPEDPAFPQAVTAAGMLDDVACFDAELFGISAREAERMDPQQRLLLEVTWEALETAGYAPNGLSGSRTGVYLGIGSPDYLRRILRCEPGAVDGLTFTGSLASVAAGRIAYLLGLQGPCMAIDTACSSSLVAVHQACASLRSGESEVALAGGVNLILSPEASYVLGQLQALSPDGRCKTFDARANGYVRGEGCGVVVLKRLSDAERDGDHVWALVRGSAVNQDGRSAGLTAPNMLAQQALLRQLLREAQVEAAAVGYVETHGTGTPLGDPIELEALTAVLGGARDDGAACVLGAVKTNLGHLEAAAGVAGLIKAVLAFAHQRIPRNLHFQALNPRCSLAGTPFQMADGSHAWPATGKARLAQVSSFGISGTNAAVMLEEPPRAAGAGSAAGAAAAAAVPVDVSAERTHHVVALSARSPSALRRMVEELARFVRGADVPELASLAYTSRVGRAAFAYRAAFAVASIEELGAALDGWLVADAQAPVEAKQAAARRPKLVLLFTGQGSQAAGMGRGLYLGEPVFRAALDACARFFDGQLPRPLLEVMWEEGGGALDRTLYSQPALFSLEWALLSLWRAWGVEAELAIGHSLGEYAAAVAAGALSLEDACRLVAERARACDALPPGGAMIAVDAAEEIVGAAVAKHGGRDGGGGALAIAAYNGPRQHTVSGEAALVRAVGEELAGGGAKVKALPTSCAFHSPLMAPMVEGFAAHLATARFSPPSELVWITNVTGEVAGEDFDGAAYFRAQLEAPVRFAACAAKARALGGELWLELGPQPVLAGAVARGFDEPPVTVASLHQGRPEEAVLARAVASLWQRGVAIDWAAYDEGRARHRTPMPTYPFERERFWLAMGAPQVLVTAASGSSGSEESEGGVDREHALLGRRVEVPGPELRFARRLSATRPAALGDHRLHGKVVVPAALYLAAFWAALRERRGVDEGALGEVELLRALAIPDEGEVATAVVVTPEEDGGGGGARLELWSRAEEDAEWALHARARVQADAQSVRESDEASGSDGVEGIAAARRRCGRQVEPAVALASVWTDATSATDAVRGAAPAMSLGPAFRCLDELWLGEGEAVARLREGIGSSATGELSLGMIDAGFQLLGLAAGAREGEEAWMPVGMASAQTMGGMRAGAELWAHATAELAADGGEVRGVVRWLDERDAVVAELRGVRLVRVASRALAGSAQASWRYRLRWPRMEQADRRDAGEERARFAVVLDRGGLGERFARALAERGVPVMTCAGPEALSALDGLELAHLISFDALDGGTAAEVCGRALALIQAHAAQRWKQAPRLWLVTRGAQRVEGAPGGEALESAAAQAAVWGIGRCAALELPQLWGGLVDLEPLDEAVSGGEIPVQLAELVRRADKAGEAQLAIRRGAWHVARLVRAEAQPARLDERGGELREDATYVVSGGLGALGWRVAQEWIARGARQLVLLGRSAPSAAQREELDELAACGVGVRVLAVDVSDGAALAERWTAVRDELPAVRGVVHAAGTLADASLLRLDVEGLAAALAPKLDGARNLARLFGGESLEHFAMFSSLAGVLGSPGQGAYAAANAALDALAGALRAEGVPATSLAWGPWQVGMAAAHQQAMTARGIAALPVEPALTLLVEHLVSGEANLVIAAGELGKIAAAMPARSRRVLERFASQARGAERGSSSATTAAAMVATATAGSGRDPLGLAAMSAARRSTVVLERVTRELRELLGRAPHVRLDPEQSLFELGLDSLSAVQLRAALTRAFGCALPASLAFEHPTLAALSEAVIESVLSTMPAETSSTAPAEQEQERSAAPSSISASISAQGATPDELLRQVRDGARELSSLPLASLAQLAEALRGRAAEQAALAAEPIAIIGMGCRFPGGVRSPDELWQLLAGGVDAITEIPAERWDRELWYDADPEAAAKTRIRHGGFLDDVDAFDARFFRISPREARCMDPQHRLLLEVSWEALEHAGQDPHRLTGSRTGVFMGFMNNDYASLAELSELEGHLATGNGISNAVGRLSFALGLHGPSVALDTACSSSLVAIHHAVESLRKRESELALAGGVSLILSPGLTVLMSKLGGLALDGHCKTFDAGADGYVRSEGCGVLVLKRLGEALRDRDQVVAVIRGSATNHGGRSGGFSQPNGRAQQALIREALAKSQTRPAQIGYLEAHGTGTPLGDPIEYRAAAAVLSAGRSAETPLYLGSIKTNFGHAEAAAGVAGVLKTALALQAKQIPPHLNLRQLSPEIDLSLVPARIPAELAEWPPIDGRRLAGVSGFGMSGINAHVVLEEAGVLGDPAARGEGGGEESGDIASRAELVVLSAQSEAALSALATAYAEKLDGGALEKYPLRELAGTAGARRAHHEVRLAVVVEDRAALGAELRAFAAGQRGGKAIAGKSEAGKRPRVVFVCPGQGSQWQGMGRELYAGEPVFRAAFERTAEAMRPHLMWSPVERLLGRAPGEGELAGIDVIQPLLFAMSVALGELWRAWGVVPDAVVGHSMGEVAAAHLAGALSLDDAARVICQRSRLMLAVAGRGAMAVVELGEAALRPRLARHGEGLCVAAANSTRSSVVAGEAAAVEALLGELAAERIFARAIKVDVASHSPQVDPLAEPLAQALRGLAPRPAELPMWSSVAAEVATGETLDAGYWMRNLRQPVRFAETIEALLAAEHALFVELSPHPILATAIAHTAEDGGHWAWVAGSLQRDKPERSAMLRALGELYARGLPVDFRRLYPGAAAVPLPTYPFQRQRYWVEQVETTPLLLRHRPELARSAKPRAEAGAAGGVAVSARRELAHELVWEETAAPVAGEARRILLVADRGGVAEALEGALVAAGHEVAVTRSAAIVEARALAELAAGRPFAAVADLRALDPEEGSSGGAVEDAREVVAARAARVTQLVRALAEVGSPPLWLVTRGGQSASGEAAGLVASSLWGFGRALAGELPAGRLSLVDLANDLGDAGDGAAHLDEVAQLASWLAAAPGTRAPGQLALRERRALAPRLARAQLRSDAEVVLSGDRTYWIPGGLGGFAGAAARQLVARGVRHLLVTGTAQELSSDLGRAQEQELVARGVTVQLAPVSLGDEAAISALLAAVEPPLAGLWHAVAPAAAPSPTAGRRAELDEERVGAAIRALDEAAWSIERATRGLPLEHALFFGPASALLGGAGQTAAAAATEAAIALAARWRGRGVAARAFLLASWPGTEDVALERLGIAPVAASEVIDWALAAIVEPAPASPSLLLADMDWSLFRAAYAQRGDERFLGELGAQVATSGASRWSQLSPEAAGAALRELVANEAREVLGAGADAALPLDTPFTELGMDSVMALQLMTRLSRALDQRLATVLVFEHPTVTALASHLVTAVLGSRAAAEDDEEDEDDDLSEDELAALLADKLGAADATDAASEKSEKSEGSDE